MGARSVVNVNKEDASIGVDGDGSEDSKEHLFTFDHVYAAGTEQGTIGTAVAIYDYDSGTDTDLKLKEGDKIVLVEKVETWYKGYLENEPETTGASTMVLCKLVPPP